MEFKIATGDPETQTTACLVLPLFEKGTLSPAAKKVDKAAKGYLTSVIKQGDIEGKSQQTLLLQSVPNIKAKRVLLVGCGKQDNFNDTQYNKVMNKTAAVLKDIGVKDAIIYLSDLPVEKHNAQWTVTQAITQVQDHLYQFNQLKSTVNNTKPKLTSLSFAAPLKSTPQSAKDAVKHGKALAQGKSLTKDLCNLPANICTPSYLAKEAKKLAKDYTSITTKVVNEAEMKKLGMGALLSVSQGSDEPGKLISMEYRGAAKTQKPIVLVGKGVTFDSGGISIKPSASMDEMKYDMGGAASVFGTIKTIAEMKLKINVVGVVPTCENLLNGSATKPGDIVTTMSGQTVEILNTDAEGRLILCDALTYCAKFKPDTVIDIATLTGAMVVALGAIPSGMFSNDETLAKDLLTASDDSGDKIWRMPLWDEYQEELDSNFADMANIGGRWGGGITAASFLQRFTRDYKWAHLDIAGTAWLSGKQKGATGRPVPLLVQYLINRAGK